MRGILSRNSSRKKVVSSERPAHSVDATKIPKPLHKRVNERIQQLAREQEHEAEALQRSEDSEDSENSILQANSHNTDRKELDKDSDEEKRIPQWTNSAFQTRSSTDAQSDRLLASIGSDLSDAAIFEEEASVCSNGSVVKGPFLKPPPTKSGSSTARSSLLVGRNDATPPPWETKVPSRLLGLDATQGKVATTRKQVLNRADHSISSAHGVVIVPRPSLAQKSLLGMTVIVLFSCLVYQLILFPTLYLVWCATALSLCLSGTLLWPHHRTIASHDKSDKTAMGERRQTLLSEGLPYRSRQVVAQANIRRLNHNMKVLKKLQTIETDFRFRQQQHALALTVQVLLKSNRSAASCHLNALTLSVLPSKLATIGVKVDKAALAALAKSRRGSRVILFELFQDLMTDKPIMFSYPPLREAKSPSSKQRQVKASRRRSKLQRVEAI